MVEVERQIGSAAGNLLAVADQLFHPVDLRERAGHGAHAPCTDTLGMVRQHAAAAHTAAAHVHDHPEGLALLRFHLGGSPHPGLRQAHALKLGEHIPLARGAVDEHTLQTVAGQQLRIGGDNLIVNLAVRQKRRKRRVDKTVNLFHINNRLKITPQI